MIFSLNYSILVVPYRYILSGLPQMGWRYPTRPCIEKRKQGKLFADSKLWAQARAVGWGDVPDQVTTQYDGRLGSKRFLSLFCLSSPLVGSVLGYDINQRRTIALFDCHTFNDHGVQEMWSFTGELFHRREA